MMSKYQREHHQIIESALTCFNAGFFLENNIIFGGGTRIALELDEFRESVDIDFLCPNKESFRAVRQVVTQRSLNDLVLSEFEYLRDIRSDRDAVRTIIGHEGGIVKLEFVSFADYELKLAFDKTKFPVPFLDQESCFYTKLLANCDRRFQEPFKDIFDILAMFKSWGAVPKRSIELAEEHYGKRVVVPNLVKALEDVCANQTKYFVAAQSVKMKKSWASDLIQKQAFKLLKELIKE